jgi:hypothetical protein
MLDAERDDPAGLNAYLPLSHLGAGPKRTPDHLHDRLGALLGELTRRGYQFVRVDNLLRLDKPRSARLMPSLAIDNPGRPFQNTFRIMKNPVEFAADADIRIPLRAL